MTTATPLRAAIRPTPSGSEPPLAADGATKRDLWAAVAPAAAGVQRSPQDHELRLALAEGLAGLGLVTLAGAALAGLPDAWQGRPRPKAVREAIAGAPDDLLDPVQLEAT